jgi:hypothetical protein
MHAGSPAGDAGPPTLMPFLPACGGMARRTPCTAPTPSCVGGAALRRSRGYAGTRTHGPWTGCQALESGCFQRQHAPDDACNVRLGRRAGPSGANVLGCQVRCLRSPLDVSHGEHVTISRVAGVVRT